MSKKSIIFIAMFIGSFIGGYSMTLFGCHSISFASLAGSSVGGLAGIWIAWKYFS
jgi:hypothetical protein